jgi:hypothetical protein
MRDPSELFAALARSRFRSRCRLGQSDMSYLRRKGIDAVLGHARRFVIERLAAAEPVDDGKQTPLRGHPAFVAQHATATCCRGCLQKWHRISRGRPLEGAEIDYVVDVIGRWLKAQAAEAPAPPPGDRQLPLWTDG